MLRKFKYRLDGLRFVKALFGPFRPFGLKFYFGKVAIGTPYFLPRRVVGNKFVPRKFGFDFVRLGYKTKWEHNDYRFEWAPMLSFVCFNRQLVISVSAPCQDHYWEAWLFYEYQTDKRLPTWLRVRHCREQFPLTYKIYNKSKTDWKTESEEVVDYYTKILKPKYLG